MYAYKLGLSGEKKHGLRHLLSYTNHGKNGFLVLIFLYINSLDLRG